MSGFASGFSQGMNSMTNLLRLKDASEYRNKELGLRQARMDQDNEHWNKDYGLRDADQQYRHDDGDRNFNLNNEKFTQEKQRDQWSHDDNRERTAAINQGTQSMNDWRQHQIDAADKQEYMVKAKQISDAMHETIEAGGTPSWEGLKFLTTGKYADSSPYNPKFIMDPENLQHTTDLIKRVSENQGNWNTPANVESSNKIFANELSGMNGKTDPGNGKVIKGRSIARFVPSPDGKHIVPELNIDYTDGTSEKTPLTKYGSTHPDDQVLAIPVDMASQQIFGRRAQQLLWSQALKKDPNILASLGGNQKAIHQKVADTTMKLEESRLKDRSTILKNATAGQEEQTAASLENIDKTYKDLEDNLPSMFGVKGAKSTADQNAADLAEIAKQPDFMAFAKDLASGEHPVDVTSIRDPEVLGRRYIAWRHRQKEETEASSDAETMRRGYSGANGR